MFENVRKAYFYARTTMLCLDAFGVDLQAADRTYDGIFSDLCGNIWSFRRTKEEAVTVCLTHLLTLQLDEFGSSPDFSHDFLKWVRWEQVFRGWAAQGLITRGALTDFELVVQAAYD